MTSNDTTTAAGGGGGGVLYNDSDVSTGGGPPDQYDYRVCSERGGWVHLTVKPIVYTVGIVGIVLTIAILSRKTMCTSTNCYLTALAVADLILLLLLSANIVVEHLTSCLRDYEDVFFVYFHISTIFVNIALFASVWITVVLAVERYIAICHPMQAMSICTATRARIMVASVFVAAFIVRLPNFLDMEISEMRLADEHNKTYTKLVMQWRGHLMYNLAVYSFIVPGFLTGLLPLVALAVLNACLVVEIRKSTRYLRYHLAVDSRIHSVISNEEKRITLMLIFIIVAFFICQCPFVVYTAIVAVNDHYFQGMPFYLQLVHDVTLIVLAMKSACNFILYCWFSEKFWITFKQIFCLRHCLPEHPLMQNGHNGCQRNGSASHRTSCFVTRETTC